MAVHFNKQKRCRTFFRFGEHSLFPMQLIKSIVYISVLSTNIYAAESIIKTPKSDGVSTVRASIDIVESCYADGYTTVGLAGPSVGKLVTEISSRDTVIPTIVIDEISTVPVYRPSVQRGSRHKLQVFVITTTDDDTLLLTIRVLRNSRWWNHMASFLLVDVREEENGCAKVLDILWFAWLYSLINAKYVCLNETKDPLIYTYHPYTNKVPSTWTEKDVWLGANDHPWTLFTRDYHKNKSLCDGLDFDKTVDLGGYEVTASVFGREMFFGDDIRKRDFVTVRQNLTAEILMSSLNATWKLLENDWRNWNVFNNEGINWSAGQVTSGNSDILLNLIAQQSFANYDITDPVEVSNLMFYTQFPGHKSQLDKLISVLDRRSRFGVLVVATITLLFSKFLLKEPWIPSIMNIVLLICNAGFPRVPRNTAPRIYLAGLFIFVVTIQGIYSGIFASLLTKDVRLRTINTMDDLARSDFTIHGYHEYRIFFDEALLEKRYVDLEIPTCLPTVITDPKAACVEQSEAALYLADRHKVHLSSETFGLTYFVLLMRPDWPLEERVNEIYRRAAAGQLIKSQYIIERDRVMRSVKSYEDQENEPEVKVLTFEQLKFAFVILGIGLTCATITFIIEVATFKFPN